MKSEEYASEELVVREDHSVCLCETVDIFFRTSLTITNGTTSS